MKRTHNSNSRRRYHHHIKRGLVVALSAAFIGTGLIALWIATLKIPDVKSFENRKVVQSTKIYDRTGNVLLYDTGSNSKRTIVPLSTLPKHIPLAAIAIEDTNFYSNSGIEPLSILRAVIADVISGSYAQGASTITQQVVKNSLLTIDKTPTRKIKEWVLAIKLTRVMSKDEILETYLNETSYGGTIFGVEEASLLFFGHSAKDDTLAEAAYLAAIPQAPTYYSPYGTHTEALTSRQRLVLRRMKELNMITDDEYQGALKEKVQFLSKDSRGIRAPHFVMYVRDYLVSKYGEDKVDSGGLKVITTLDYAMQQKAEDVIKKFSPSLATNFNASNTAMVAIDPKTGDILTMVGSRDYFDRFIDGNFNVSIAKRQPGSTFKPFVYATDFIKGYTPETILFDIKTEFSTECNPDGTPKRPSDDQKKTCYSPGEYDNLYEGPMSIRRALAHSRNIPAVQALYLAGINRTVSTARVMGVTIENSDRCGLTLVLGGCEVSLLDLTSAYGVFANDGIRNAHHPVLEVTDLAGNVLEKYATSPSQVIPAEAARQISSILSDTEARMDSLKPIGQSVARPVAIKTGTTNDYRDVWTLGYTPNLVVGAWAGNNNNKALTPNVAGLIISPLWGAFMSQVAKNYPPEDFIPPPAPLTDGKPILRGVWQGGVSYWKDKVSGKVATEYTPPEAREEVVFNNVHSILYWVNKDDPRGPIPSNPAADSQFESWEYAMARWLPTYKAAHPEFIDTSAVVIPTAIDDVHTSDNAPRVFISSPAAGSVVNPNQSLSIQLQNSGRYPIMKTEVYLNEKFVTTVQNNPTSFSFVPADVGTVPGVNTLSVTVYDTIYNKSQATTTFSVTQ